jgi:serine protease Do
MGVTPGVGLVVTDVRAGSLAARGGVRPGDLILQANGQTVESVQEFEKIYEQDAKKKKVLLLLINREGHNLFRTINLEEE